MVDFSQLPDGLLGVMCRGSRRSVASSGAVRWTAGERSEWLGTGPGGARGEHRPLALSAARAAGLGDTARHLDADFDDAIGSQLLAEFLPLERTDQQALLDCDPQERMRRLAPLIEVATDNTSRTAVTQVLSWTLFRE